MSLVFIILLVIIILLLLIYNLSISKKIKKFNSINEQITGLKILQDFMDIIGKDNDVEVKLRTMNEILVERHNIKYSTLVVFDGAEYVVRASNVDTKHWEMLKTLHNQQVFKESISSTTPKYITVNNVKDKLPYQELEFARAKSAMFFPLYIDNVYIGYWLIESEDLHAYDRIDTSILEIIRENIISVLKSISYQTTIENIYRKDKFSDLYSAEYLYGKTKSKLDKFASSTICLFSIVNLETINKKFGRELGNQVVIKVSNTVKMDMSTEYVFVRYMGPKFAICLPNVEPTEVTPFIKKLKEDIENISLESEIELIPNNKKQNIVPSVNFVASKYYKGTQLENLTKKLEEYLDNAGEESNINYI